MISYVGPGDSWEYFCHGCKQLRLWLKDDQKPTRCGNCGGTKLTVGACGILDRAALLAKGDP